MFAAKNRNLQNGYPPLGEERHTWEIDSENAKGMACRMPTRSSKRKRSPPTPVPATDTTVDGQKPESSKTGEKRVKWGPNGGR